MTILDTFTTAERREFDRLRKAGADATARGLHDKAHGYANAAFLILLAARRRLTPEQEAAIGCK